MKFLVLFYLIRRFSVFRFQTFLDFRRFFLFLLSRCDPGEDLVQGRAGRNPQRVEERKDERRRHQ